MERLRLLYRPGTTKVRKADDKWHFTGIMVQHNSIAISDDANLRVGDIISFSTPYSCLTLDKWPNICIIEDHYHIEQVVSSYF